MHEEEHLLKPRVLTSLRSLRVRNEVKLEPLAWKMQEEESNQLTLHRHDECKTKYCITKQGPNTEPPLAREQQKQ